MASEYRDIISSDFVNKTFTTLKITNVEFDFENKLFNIFYEGCISPMILSPEEYETLCLEHIVELHQGEVAICWV